MKKLGIVLVAVLATACVLAQEKPRRGGKHRGERPAAGERQMHGPMMHAAGAWVPRMLSNKASLEKIGVTDEALSTKLLAELKPLREQGDLLEQKIREVSREQAKLMQGLLKDKGSDPKPVMEKCAAFQAEILRRNHQLNDRHNEHKEQLHEYRDHMTEKVGEYRELVTEKVGEYREHVTEKVVEYREQVTEKVGEYKEHVSEKIDKFRK